MPTNFPAICPQKEVQIKKTDCLVNWQTLCKREAREVGFFRELPWSSIFSRDPVQSYNRFTNPLLKENRKDSKNSMRSKISHIKTLLRREFKNKGQKKPTSIRKNIHPTKQKSIRKNLQRQRPKKQWQTHFANKNKRDLWSEPLWSEPQKNPMDLYYKKKAKKAKFYEGKPYKNQAKTNSPNRITNQQLEQEL